MDQKQQALRGYGKAKQETASDKHIELQLFTSITARLRAQANKNSTQLNSVMAQALIDNAKLWNILFCDLVSQDNQLPLDLKKNLISLAEFTQEHTQRVFRGEAGMGILIEVNDSVIIGLKTALMAQKNQSNSTSTTSIQEVA
jgi:flagellar protein FlaF